MVSVPDFKAMILDFPETEEAVHFDKSSFKVKKKIFATLNEKEGRITIRLSPMDQSIMCNIDKNIIYPVPNKWGHQGWTHVILDKVSSEMLHGFLVAAFCEVAPKKLADAFLDGD